MDLAKLVGKLIWQNFTKKMPKMNKKLHNSIENAVFLRVSVRGEIPSKNGWLENMQGITLREEGYLW
ncbi:hypothetical protein ACFSCX_16450 [Bacillus salitolerans]|uniref:Transposase n=1 Tax=Bacillus salitolerans TaxID=1437434 RepID=A0ABW4LSS1_9BACI